MGKIKWRFSPVNSVEDLTDSQQGMEKLDSICMLLVAIGESLKKIDRLTDGNLLSKYAEVDWKGVKGLRDVISHHYFDVDAEEIYFICFKHVPTLTNVIQKILEDMENQK